MTQKSVLVTGATGFIGLNLILKLLNDKDRYKVYAISNEKEISQYLFPKNKPDVNVHSIKVDLYKFESIDACFQRAKPDWVIHLAGIVTPEHTFKNWQRCVDINIEGTLNLLECCNRYRVNRFIFCSTTDVYGELESPFLEEQNFKPSSPYAISKASAEMLCSFYQKEFSMQIVILRIGNVFGPFQRRERLIPMIIDKAHRDEPIILHSPEVAKDFCFSGDVVRAIELSMSVDEFNSEVINISSGMGIKVIDIAHTIIDIMKSNSQIMLSHPDAHKSESRYSYCDISKAKRVLNWSPEYSLREGLVHVIPWYKKDWKSSYD